MNNKIPCDECICLAICKPNHSLHCTILFSYLDKIHRKDDSKWKLLEEFFYDRGAKIMNVYPDSECGSLKFLLVESPHPTIPGKKNFIMSKYNADGMERVLCKDVKHLEAALKDWREGGSYEFLRQIP
jgi:hypothetical protein